MTRKIPFGKPVFSGGELDRIKTVLDSGILTHGKLVKEFEDIFAKFIGTKYAIAVSSCTAGLHLSLMALGIKPGDEVIVPAMTHTATAHVVEFCGAKPIFADISDATGNIDPDQIVKKIGPKTRAIEVVHFLGLPCDMAKINEIARQKDIAVIEDCALALGATYKGKKAGALSLTGSFSFYPVKHIATAEGGMLTTDDEKIALSVSRQRAFGIDKSLGERKVPGVYDVVCIGNNYRMSELQAVLGISQMKDFEMMNRQRKQNYKRLREGLDGLKGIQVFQEQGSDSIGADYCLNIIINNESSLSRDEFIFKLNGLGVGTSIYYATPVPLLTCYRDKYGYKPGDFPNAEFLANNSLALPVGQHLSEDDIDYIVKTIKEIVA